MTGCGGDILEEIRCNTAVIVKELVYSFVDRKSKLLNLQILK